MAEKRQQKGYLGNAKLKKAGVQIEWTQEMRDEWERCQHDPIYFTQQYIKIINLNDGLVNFRPYEYQKQIIQTVHDERFTIVLTGRQSGKCLTDDQKINIKNKKTGEIMDISFAEFKILVDS